MQVTSLSSRHEHAHDHSHGDHDHGHGHGDHDHGHGDDGCAHDHSHSNTPLPWLITGLLFVINSFIVGLILGKGHYVDDFSAMIGAIILGFPIIRTAVEDLRRGALTTNELVAIAVLASFASGHYQEAGVVAFFMLLGEIIETRTAAGARASIESLIKLTPTKARRITSAGEEEIAVKDLSIGDVIRIRPGDNVSADGVIVSGSGSINQANITGESLPVDKKPGDDVFAGTQNLTGLIEVRVTKVSADSALGRVRELILAAEKTKLPLMKIVDQYMSFYTPLVLVIGALVWAFTQDLQIVITIFIAACPCAFILATPTAMVAALSAASRLGILIKNVSDIEAAAKINAFVFDKTGTITTGKLAVSRLAPLNGAAPADLLRSAAAAEKYSNHPTAKALAQLAQEAGVPLPEPQDFSETAGLGVQARVDGARVLVGRAQWLRDNGVVDDFTSSVDVNETEGYSLVFVARDAKCIGWVGMQDQVRSEARAALADLKQEGVRRISLVSGDRTPVAQRVGREIGCDDIVGDCLPQNKVEFVHQIHAKGYKVAVVGDGVNDAPALAAGDIGIAMGAAGSEVAIHSATIALMNNDLRRLPFLVRLSRMTRMVINQNFFFGVLFVLGGFILAALKVTTPIAAAVLHVVGAMLVIFNSARLVRQGEELDPFHAHAPSAPAKAENASAGELAVTPA